MSQQSGGLFPLPAMREVWPGAKLDAAHKRLLKKAVVADMAASAEGAEPEVKYSFDRINTADIELGSLGKGVIITLSESNSCGTGGCPIYAYVHEKGRYRKVLESFGWAYAVVKSNEATPNLVIASNGGGGQMSLMRYRYAGKAFKEQACEVVSSKDGNTPSSWWNSAEVNLAACNSN